MKRFKVERVVLCQVRVWGWIAAEYMPDATAKFLETDTGDSDYDHEIISDLKTISMEITEEV